MGGIAKALGKVASFVKPFVSMVNPMLGAAIGFAGDLLQGKNPLKSLLSTAMDFIPGNGVLKNVLGKFGGSSLMDGMGGNSLLSGALDLATGKKKITDVVGDFLQGATKSGPLSDMGLSNVTELAAQRMSRTLLS